ncbi:hypothetical protein [Ferrovibrio sp.]|uniref:hypothetical protein n=1 Tax=Ferrovibrio sp. TaxID=1917215 RepID=UPI0026153234|nr:hypothetical protein [Ferrovibrio sp.]
MSHKFMTHKFMAFGLSYVSWKESRGQSLKPAHHPIACFSRKIPAAPERAAHKALIFHGPDLGIFDGVFGAFRARSKIKSGLNSHKKTRPNAYPFLFQLMPGTGSVGDPDAE